MSAVSQPSLKQKIGCWAHERWRTELALALPGLTRPMSLSWPALCNRNERLVYDFDTGSFACDWEDTSQLTVARTFPAVGARLLKRCFNNWPIRIATGLEQPGGNPDVSIVVGVRGLGRLPQFRATLASLMGQSGCTFEIIVVEQGWERCFTAEIPPGVRYVYTKTVHAETPFNRSWALNVGTRAARGRVVVLHDADMLVPEEFAKTVSETVRGSVDGMRIPRFIFYLDRSDSTRLMETGDVRSVRSVDVVVQNNRTPIAVTRAALLEIGGHDESFWGWGGEDNEFIDRARTLRFSEGAIFPLIHLWHETAPTKSGHRNRGELQRLMEVPVSERIGSLSNRQFGGMEPTVDWRPFGSE